VAVLEPAGEELAPIVWQGLLRPLVKVAAWFVTWGLSALAYYITKAFFGTAIEGVSWIPWAGSWAKGKLQSIEHRLVSSLGEYMAGADAHMGIALHNVAKLADQLADTQVSVAVNLWHQARSIANLWGNAATGNLFKKTHATATHAQAVAQSAINTATRENHRASTYAGAQVVPKVGRIEAEYDHLIDAVIPNLRANTRTIENSLTKLWHNVRSREKLLVGTAFAGAVAVALGRLGLGGLRCSSFRSLLNRFGCGGWKLLDDLLALVVDVLVIADLCQLTKLLIEVAESSEVQGALSGIIAGMDELLLCQGVTRPPALAFKAVSLPPLQAFAQLPAV
jgi:hypothetical protein